MSARNVEVSISCKGLPFVDSILKSKLKSSKGSDKSTGPAEGASLIKAASGTLTGKVSKQAQAVVYLQDQLSGQWGELHATNVVSNTANPDFKPFCVAYKFQALQPLRIDINAGEGGATLGSVEISVAQLVVGGHGQEYPLMSGGLQVATILFHVEEFGQSEDANITFNMRGIKLAAMDTFGKSDPFILISRNNEGGHWVQVHKTEWIKQNLNPTWHPVQLTLDQLCGGDKDRLIKFECFDYDKGGKADFIGEYVASYNQIEANAGAPVPLVNPKKQEKDKKYKNSGELVIETTSTHRPSFYSYAAAKFHIDLAVFIDYTASNEPHTERHSLHFLSAKHSNPYQKVLSSITNIILPYTTDTHMFGFGAKVLPTKKTSHCFSLNFADESGLVESNLQGIMSTYAQSLDNVILHGPTYFVPILTKIKEMAIAREQELSHKYLFCVIITDGEIDDLKESCKLLSQICTLAVSIVIVGVGSSLFKSMEVLDDDEGELGLIRDVVQFVPFAKVEPEDLMEEILGEIPKQYVDYMMDHKVSPSDGQTPQRPRTASMGAIAEKKEKRASTGSKKSDKEKDGKKVVVKSKKDLTK